MWVRHPYIAYSDLIGVWPCRILSSLMWLEVTIRWVTWGGDECQGLNKTDYHILVYRFASLLLLFHSSVSVGGSFLVTHIWGFLFVLRSVCWYSIGSLVSWTYLNEDMLIWFLCFFIYLYTLDYSYLPCQLLQMIALQNHNLIITVMMAIWQNINKFSNKSVMQGNIIYF